jgi:hypothetical protein
LSHAASEDDRARLAAATWLPAAGPYVCFGETWRLRTTDAAFLSHLDDLYAPMRATSGDDHGWCATYSVIPVEGNRPGLVARGDVVTASRTKPSMLLRHLVWSINRQVIDVASDRGVLLHAAGAVIGGMAIVLPAQMQAGKTTLVTGLLDRGAAYLTDEAVRLTDDLEVEGFPKPLSIDRGSWGLLSHRRPRLPPSLMDYHASQWHVPPSSFASVARAAPLGAVVFPRYERDAPTDLRVVRPAEALERAVRSTFATTERVPADKVRKLAALLSAVPCYTLTSGSLDEACAAILNLPRRRRHHIADHGGLR